ncbi:MAG: electron transfer flavoprotein beta subunit/FixA family protein [Flavobacteriales bacterium TMED235]|jgi:electron transfer flavoprotein beta subunit|nr:MAG: electron transfer flavoprotein beta subunit/FixA family protein [Flavobacteriales bacterium TMED235]|tara:strand:- start:12585 stop:13331 length:747 start_codon:yes stop_codon:yes gene_type:complete
MKILVCISHVPDTTSKINFVDDDTVFDKNGVKFVINPNDEFGLTRAVWFQQKQQAEVTVVTVGDPSCEPTLRKCLAIGADKAVRIDLNPTDGFQVAQQLSAHCKVENYDLIIAGRESIDYNGAMVPGMVSALLGYNFVTNCMALEIDGNSVKASREIDEGIESVSCQLPLVIGAQKGLVEEKDLIIPNMRGIMQARQKSLSVIPPVEGEIRSSITKFEKPAPKEAVKMVDADQIDQLIDLLHNEAKVI